MAQQTSCTIKDKSLLEKLGDFLKRKPTSHDVIFSVGPEKKSVPAIKILLKAASPVFETEFEERWESAVVKEGEGIPLPDLDPEAFQLFIKLTMSDKWDERHLKGLNLTPDQVLNLIVICRRFEMGSALRNLEEMAQTFFRSFHLYADTGHFLKMSRANLATVLSSNQLQMEEIEVFKAGCRWAEHQCQQNGKEKTGENLREFLGPSLFEIRFPLMSNKEFTKVLKFKNLLTASEIIDTYQYIGLEDDEKLIYTRKASSPASLPLKFEPRQTLLQRQPKVDQVKEKYSVVAGSIIKIRDLAEPLLQRTSMTEVKVPNFETTPEPGEEDSNTLWNASSDSSSTLIPDDFTIYNPTRKNKSRSKQQRK